MLRQLPTFYIPEVSEEYDVPEVYLYRGLKELSQHIGRRVLAIQEPEIELPQNYHAEELSRFLLEYAKIETEEIKMLLGEKFCGADGGERVVSIKTPVLGRIGRILSGKAKCARIEDTLASRKHNNPNISMEIGLQIASCNTCSGVSWYRKVQRVSDEAWGRILAL